MESNSGPAQSDVKKLTQQLKAWDKQYVWHPFSQMQDYDIEDPLVIASGEGIYVYDVEGNRYIDGNASLWVNLHGHAHPAINQALSEQAQRIAHSTLLGSSNVPSIEFAKRLIDLAPEGLAKVFYSDNGSTAMEVAVKMAFQYWQQSKNSRPSRCKFIKFEDAYHGDTLGSVSVGGIDLFHGLFQPLLFDTFSAPYPVYSRYTSPDSPEQLVQRSIDACQAILNEHEDEVAAIVIEPLVQGASGIQTMAPGFLKPLRELCDRYGVLLICDEVFVGFGRTGTLFGCNHEGITPDLMALAKGINGGYLPLAATLATDEIYQAFLGNYSEFKQFFHGHSFTGNQLGCATALASIDLLEQNNTLQAMQPSIERLQQRLDALFEQCDQVQDIHQVGLIAGIDICASRQNNQPFPIENKMGYQACQAMRKHGVLLRALGNTLVVVPPLVITPDQIDALMDGIEAGMNDALAP